LDIVQKIWASLRKLFATPGAPSWLRAWFWLLGPSVVRARQLFDE